MAKKKVATIAIDKLQLDMPELNTPHPDAVLDIEFEDQGQDFLNWQVDKNGTVVKCTPYQGWLWEGTWVDLAILAIGVQPTIITKQDDLLKLNYKVISVKEV